MPAILPGATLGILGGGQLGRMTALAARPMGYHIHVLDPDPSCAARFVVERCVTAAFDDAHAATELAKGCAVVTFEIEKIGIAGLRAAAEHAPVRPSADVLAVVQDRGAQKRWLEAHGFPMGPYQEVTGVAALAVAAHTLGGACFVKAVTGGYDGRSQVRLDATAQAAGAWDALGAQRCVVEQALDIEAELSVLVARRPSGEMSVYPPALNHHERRILDWSVIPGPVPAPVAAEATDIARGIAQALDVEGLLVIELFLLRDGRVLVNELAPRPHNSFHATEVACVTSQFEQGVRAVCDLPLGSVEIVRPAAIVNLLGDLWLRERPPAFDSVMAMNGVRVHLYSKRIARPGRKMGHLSAVGTTPEEALARVQAARARLLGE